MEQAIAPGGSGNGLIGVRHDHERKGKGKKGPKDGGAVESSYQRCRVVLKPDSESLWEFLCHLNVKNGRSIPGNADWDDEAMLQLEARILAAIAPPLNLDTSILPTRIANVASALTHPALSNMNADGSYFGPPKEKIVLEGPTRQEAEHEQQQLEQAQAQKPNSTDVPAIQDHSKTDEWLQKQGLVKEDMDILLAGKERFAPPSTNPFEAMHWVKRTLSFLQMRHPAQPLPHDVVITHGNLVNGVPAANGGRQNSVVESNSGGDGIVPPAPPPEEKKKPVKKKKKPAAPKDSEAVASIKAPSVVATPASAKKELPESAEKDKKGSKAKSKKKKDPEENGAPVEIPAPSIATKSGKKRTADEMGTENGVKTVNVNFKEEAGAAPGTAKPTAYDGKKPPAKKTNKKTAGKTIPAEPEVKLAEPPKKKAKKNKDAAAKETANGNVNANGNTSIPSQHPSDDLISMLPADFDLSALAQFVPADAMAPGAGPNSAGMLPDGAFLGGAPTFPGGNPADPMMAGMPVLPLQAQPLPPPPVGIALNGQDGMNGLPPFSGSADDMAAIVAALGNNFPNDLNMLPVPNSLPPHQQQQAQMQAMAAASRHPGSRAPPT